MRKFFRFMRQLETEYERNLYGTNRRDLDDDDRTSWDDALDEDRDSKPKNMAEVRRALKRYNKFKYNQMMRDYRWLQKQMKKMGHNPEDARYIYE